MFTRADMEQLIIKSLEQAPVLTVLAIIVWLFLKVGQRILVQHAEDMRGLHQEHIDERTQMRLVIKENTDSNRELIRVIHELRDVKRR